MGIRLMCNMELGF